MNLKKACASNFFGNVVQPFGYSSEPQLKDKLVHCGFQIRNWCDSPTYWTVL